MGKLLGACLGRVKKDKVFWVCVGLVSALTVFVLTQNYVYQIKNDAAYYLDSMVFGYNIFVPIQCAVFCSLFLGTEYADGVIRNKLVVGHTRTAVYLANLATAFVSSALMSLACFVICLALGVPMFGWLHMGVGPVLTILLGSLLATAAVCAICTLCAMLIHKKAVLAIVLVLGMAALMLAATTLQRVLESPAFFPYAMDIVDGEMVMTENVPNPGYPSGTERAVYQFFYDFLPTGQVMQYNQGQVGHPVLMGLYSVVITVATTVFGLFAFKRKDIK